MAKEFDIYLNKRLTECDIIVYSIPFRDGLTATNRMILESCLESYTLQKFIAVETGSELVSHIDKMIKTCNERLHMASTWGIDLEFQTHYVLNPVPTVIEIAPNDDLQTLRNMFITLDGTELGMTDSVLYIKIGNSGSFTPCSVDEAIGVAFNSEPYNLVGHDEIEGAGTVVVAKCDGGSLVAHQRDLVDELILSALEV